MVTKANKDLSVETLRGLAIILVVVGHVIGSASDGGMKVDDDSFLRHFYFTFKYLRMPLFTVISGWVYALRPARLDNLQSFTLKKVRRILLPMIFVGGAYYIIQNLVPGTNMSHDLASIWKILIFPYTLYWYLPALFWVFVIVSILDAYKLLERFNQWLLIFILTLALLLFRNIIIPESVENYFAFKMAIYLLPFFIIGIGIKRFNNVFSNKYFIWITGIILVIGLAVQQMAWYNIVHADILKKGGLGLLIGVAGVIVFFRSKLQIKWLVWLGSYAYTIYLFHAFGTAGGRILLKTVGIHNDVPVFFVSLLVGLFIPVVIEFVLDRFKLTRMLFLGRSYNKAPKKT
nr:acyltransferase [Bacteroidota bacterium]